ncbi:hypothetical protein [Leyella stercorea]|uniref:hypothetical protein n=1 Tax=Leyella stercorea TaxID=363265 RepID=UPI00266EF07D|nr:hypothetical protein [Leyella stercorea]
MKKILSLIALLVVTLTAFAQSTSEKIIPDGTQPNGGTITPKAITVDWATQKIVANVDLTNCLTGTNEQIFAISTNSADIANWDQESGSTLHFFYRQKFTEWGSTTTDVHKFAVQYRYKGDSGATNRFYEVKDISNCTIVMDKNGVTIDGTLVFEASLMPNLYKEGANQLYFGSLRGDHPYAIYKSVELVTEEGGSTPGETATYEFTNNVETVYWKEIATDDYLDFHQYVKGAKLQLVKELDGTYTATLKDVVVGEDRVSLGDIVIAGLTATEKEGKLEIDVPTSNITISAPGSPYDGKSMSIKGGMIDATPAADADSKGSASVKLTILVGNGDMISYEFSDDVYVPNIYNFTSNAYVKAGDEVTNFEDAQAVLTEYMEDVYMVKFKKLTLGTKTEDFTIENLNLKPTKDEDGNITFTTSDTSGFWNDADETELGFTDFSASVKVGENGFEGFVCKFTTENGQFVYGEKAETPDPGQPDEKYPVSFDKTALNTSAHGRMLNSFSLQQAGKEKQTKSVKTSKAAYEDHTADEPFTVEAGSELTASFDYTGEWMHSFVYIDFDNDGQFSYKEGQWDQTGTDLVAFSFYSLDSNPKNDASGYNSVGDELTGDARNTYVAPSFKAPAKAGEYRIRFKFDWNCILPGGSSTILEDGGGVWDATLKVVEPVVDGISTINAEVANGEAQLFTIDGVKLSKLQKGLNIVRTADGKVKKVLVK